MHRARVWLRQLSDGLWHCEHLGVSFDQMDDAFFDEAGGAVSRAEVEATAGAMLIPVRGAPPGMGTSLRAYRPGFAECPSQV